MTRSYCLTVDVKSDHIENGLGYMIGFRLPADNMVPSQMAEFTKWSDEIKSAVLTAGDLPFNPDPYTKKVAIAELMHTLDDINRRYNIQVGLLKDIPAVQIHSSNPYDNQISVDFTDTDGHFRITDVTLADKERARVNEHGKTAVIDTDKSRFPFEKFPPSTAPRKFSPFRPEL